VQQTAVERVARADRVDQRGGRDRHPDLLPAKRRERAGAAQTDHGQRHPEGMQVDGCLLRRPARPELVEVILGEPDDIGQPGPAVDPQPVRRHRDQQRPQIRVDRHRHLGPGPGQQGLDDLAGRLQGEGEGAGVNCDRRGIGREGTVDQRRQ